MHFTLFKIHFYSKKHILFKYICTNNYLFFQEMIELENKLISKEIFTKQFVCDLSACKGDCCIEGDAGAPLEKEELISIQENLEKIKPFMRSEGIDAVEKNGISYTDIDGEEVTTLVNGNECAFVFFDENNITKCAIEKAYFEDQSTFLKPISCHLYPIRINKLKYYDSLNYSTWDICEPACACGEELNVSVFRFLKEPLIRKYGLDFFNQLEIIDKELSK